MPGQPDLFPPRDAPITPDPARTGPRLWVRRVQIWRSPGVLLRAVTLRPGLNIVWSPDAPDGTVGHGSGKTTFCRLLRFCLGEDSYAPEAQARRIAEMLPEDRITAELVLDGRSWVVARALQPPRRDVVLADAGPQAALDAAPTGLTPLLDAIAGAGLGPEPGLLPTRVGPRDAWPLTLAWLTRDQECRLRHSLEWRDVASGSHSPARGLSGEDRLLIVRALLGAISAGELSAQREVQRLEAEIRTAGTEQERLRWQIGRTTAGLGGSGLASASLLDVAAFRAECRRRLEAVQGWPAGLDAGALAGLRRERDAAFERCSTLRSDEASLQRRIGEQRDTNGKREAELGLIQGRRDLDSVWVCPVCRVPIDRIKAEGCSIAVKPCNVEAMNERIAAAQQQIRDGRAALEALIHQADSLRPELALAQQSLDRAGAALARAERLLFERSDAVRAAERSIDAAGRLHAELEELRRVDQTVGHINAQLTSARAQVEEGRDSARDVIRGLSSRFDSLLRELVPGDTSGVVKVDGNGLTLTAHHGGEWSTAAVESLKVIAFDLACLVQGIEGKTRLPGFLLHDSPREADLGLAIYHRLFAVLGRLEAATLVSRFQYIVTTTTAPPESMQVEPWLRLRLGSAPPAARLLGMDL